MNKNNINWIEECEGYDILLPSTTGLNVTVYIDNGLCYKYYDHPLVIFINNNYNEYDMSDVIALTCDKYALNILNKRVKIFNRDFVNARLWVMKHYKKLRAITNLEYNMEKFITYLENLNESVLPLNEMAKLEKEFTGLDYDIWLDNSQAWRTSKHSGYRLKVQTPDGNDFTTSWNTFRFDLMEFETDKMKEMYSSNFYKDLKLFVEKNLNVIKEITLGEKRYNIKEIKPLILSLSQIKNKSNDEIITDSKFIFKGYLDKNKIYSILLSDDNNDLKYTIVKTDTYKNVIDNQWFTAIIPDTLKYLNDQLYVNVINKDGEIINIKIND